MNELCSQVAYSGLVDTDDLDELTSRTSKWSVECNATLDELTAQMVGFSLVDQTPLEDLSLTAHCESGPRPIDSFPEHHDETRWKPDGGCWDLTKCSFCYGTLKEAFWYDIGWYHEKQCEGCGKTDRGLGWKEKQKPEDLACTICSVRNDRFNIWNSNWQFYTKWDARQFAAWLVQHANVPKIECVISEGTIFDDEVNKCHDLRMTAFKSLREWHMIQRRFFDPVKITHDLDTMEIYEPLCQATKSFDKTFNDCHRPEMGRPRLGWGWCPDRWPNYTPGWVPYYYNSIVWIKRDIDTWMFIKRKPGELNFPLFCRAYGLDETDPGLIAVSESLNWPDEMKEFETASMSKSRDQGKICLHEGWWCWLPQMEMENPDEFARRVKQFETARVTRTKRTFHYDDIGEQFITDIVYTQEPNESLAEFTMRFHDAPGEEPRQQRPLMDWAM